MSLYIKIKGAQSLELHVPIKMDVAVRVMVYAQSNEIELIRADGDELNLIGQRMRNLPMTHAICEWHGEFAKFIGANFTNLV